MVFESVMDCKITDYSVLFNEGICFFRKDGRSQPTELFAIGYTASE
jgi:hypothetical protein